MKLNVKRFEFSNNIIFIMIYKIFDGKNQHTKLNFFLKKLMIAQWLRFLFLFKNTLKQLKIKKKK